MRYVALFQHHLAAHSVMNMMDVNLLLCICERKHQDATINVIHNQQQPCASWVHLLIEWILTIIICGNN